MILLNKKINNIKVLIIGLFLLSSVSLNAQDVHFSQMDYSPLTFNPALAGANNDLEASVIYRNQWGSVATPYQTIGASFDMRLNNKVKRRRIYGSNGKKVHIALGADLFNDKAGDTRVTTNHVNVHFATHVLLGARHSLGLGIYGGYQQRSISPAEGQWGNQYDGFHYNPDLPNGQNFTSSSFGVFDAGAGLLYSYNLNNSRIGTNDNKRINIGIAAYHVNRPNYSFLEQSNEQLYMRITGFVNASIGIYNTPFIIEPEIYYQQQENTREILLGLYWKIILKKASHRTSFFKETKLGVGLFYRNNDALIAKALFDWNGWGVGFAYDFNLLNSLSTMSRSRGGFEVALKWVVPDLNKQGQISHKSHYKGRRGK